MGLKVFNTPCSLTSVVIFFKNIRSVLNKGKQKPLVLIQSVPIVVPSNKIVIIDELET